MRSRPLAQLRHPCSRIQQSGASASGLRDAFGHTGHAGGRPACGACGRRKDAHCVRERVFAKTSRVTERLDGRLRHAPTASARFASTRRGRKARSSSLDAPSDTDIDTDAGGDSFGGSRSRTSRRANELSLSSAPQAESDTVEQTPYLSLSDVRARARSPHVDARLDFARMKQKPVEPPLLVILEKIQSRDDEASATAASIRPPDLISTSSSIRF